MVLNLLLKQLDGAAPLVTDPEMQKHTIVQAMCKKCPSFDKNLCKIVRCFVEKVSNVAVLLFFVAFFCTLWQFMLLFGTSWHFRGYT